VDNQLVGSHLEGHCTSRTYVRLGIRRPVGAGEVSALQSSFAVVHGTVDADSGSVTKNFTGDVSHGCVLVSGNRSAESSAAYETSSRSTSP